MQATIANSQTEMLQTVTFFPGERKALMLRDNETASEWVESKIIVTKSEIPGKFCFENNPPLKGIIEMYNLPYVRGIVDRKGVQTGGSLLAEILILMEMDKGLPGDVEYLKSSNPDDTAIYKLRLSTGNNILTGWGTSQAMVASSPIRVLEVDECEKFEKPINLEEAKDRTTAFSHTSKTFILSTPGLVTGLITIELNNCDVICDYVVECPHCGTVQTMTQDRIKHPEDAKASLILRKSLAWYECMGCDKKWGEAARIKAVRAGLRHYFHGWKMREEIERPMWVGFQYPSWISLMKFNALSKIAARWLRAEEHFKSTGDKSQTRMWFNQEAGEPFNESDFEEVLPAEIIHEKNRHIYGPEGAEWTVIAWAPGEESWGLKYKVFMGDTLKDDVWDMLYDFLRTVWTHESGVKLKLAGVGFDMSYRGEQVIRYFKNKPLSMRVFYMRGWPTPGKPLITKPKDKPKKGTKFTAWMIGTESAKDILYTRAALEEHGQQYMHFNMEYDFEFFSQFASEKAVIEINKRGKQVIVYVLKKKNSRNEALDIRVYNLSALHILVDYYGVNMEGLQADIEAISKGEKIKSRQRKRRVLSKGVEE
jgi:phage terminase large subunit GpA-like protein